jgi:hypothetical protein
MTLAARRRLRQSADLPACRFFTGTFGRAFANFEMQGRVTPHRQKAMLKRNIKTVSQKGVCLIKL